MVEVRWPEMELLCANRVELEVRVEGRELDGPNMHHKVGQSSAGEREPSKRRPKEAHTEKAVQILPSMTKGAKKRHEKALSVEGLR